MRHDVHFTPLQVDITGVARTALFNTIVSGKPPITFLKLAPFAWQGKGNDGQWHHILSQYDSKVGLQIYFDGKVVVSDTTMRGDLNKTTAFDFVLGFREAGGEAFTGDIDEVRIHSKTRSPDWIKLSFETQKPSSTAVTVTAQ